MYPILTILPPYNGLLLLLLSRSISLSISNNYTEQRFFSFCVWYFCKTTPHVTSNISVFCLKIDNWVTVQCRDCPHSSYQYYPHPGSLLSAQLVFTPQVSTCATPRTPTVWPPPTPCSSDNPSSTTSRRSLPSPRLWRRENPSLCPVKLRMVGPSPPSTGWFRWEE